MVENGVARGIAPAGGAKKTEPNSGRAGLDSIPVRCDPYDQGLADPRRPTRLYRAPIWTGKVTLPRR